MDNESLKIFACDIIQNSGILLKLPQIAVSTAQMLLHRVYQSKDYTIEEHPIDITAIATLFLAAKIEEYPRKAREVIDVFVYVISKKLQRDYTFNYMEHEKVREELINTERRILKNLGFNLLSSYPHKILVNYYHAIVNNLDPEHNVWKERDNQKLLQLAWNYCNDSQRTDVFIKYSKETVACACIHMACKDRQMFFPKSTDGREWYSLFVDQADLEAAIDVIKNLYSRKQPDRYKLREYLYLTNI